MFQEAGHIKNAVVLTIRHIQYLYLMYSDVAWALLSLGTQVQPQIILDPDYLHDYPSVLMCHISPNETGVSSLEPSAQCKNLIVQSGILKL